MAPRHTLPPLRIYYRKLFNNFLITLLVLTCSLIIGIAGYHIFGGLKVIDALLNASMILTGMGPVNVMPTQAAKLFSSFYALFSGVVFLSAMSIMISPIFHRVMHKFHLEISGSEEEKVEGEEQDKKDNKN